MPNKEPPGQGAVWVLAPVFSVMGLLRNSWGGGPLGEGSLQSLGGSRGPTDPLSGSLLGSQEATRLLR